MLSIKDGRRGLNFSRAIGTTGEGGQPVDHACRFRTGSITKLFTATVLLQLAEEGFLKLDDLFLGRINEDIRKRLSGLHCLEQVDHSHTITILHLLNHTSGLQDYFSGDERFLGCVLENPRQTWNWELVMEKYFAYGLNQTPVNAPGKGYHYADTNYLLLAVLIEQLTGQPLSEVYHDRILTPLGLSATYLEFFSFPGQGTPVVYPYYGAQSLERVNTSFDWGGGGLISSMHELDVFIHRLLKGELFKKTETLHLLMKCESAIPVSDSTRKLLQYGLGIQRQDLPGYSFYGHYSAYGGLVFYEPRHEISIVLNLNQAAAVHKAAWLFKKVIEEFYQA
ncbi:MAG: beta-lactamase family protein [Lewinellaceae bacterium]|nr:beta-lactamase family protein [Lewinellaceae bacterium]